MAFVVANGKVGSAPSQHGDEFFAEDDVAGAGCDMQGRAPMVVESVGIGAGVDERFGRLEVGKVDGVVQSAAAFAHGRRGGHGAPRSAGSGFFANGVNIAGRACEEEFS